LRARATIKADQLLTRGVKRLVLFILTICCASMAASQEKAANTSPTCRKTLPIDEFLMPDDAAAAKAALEELRVALQNGDRSGVIALVAFPADLVLDGSGVKFDTPREFEKRYDRVFTAYVANSVRDQNPEELRAGWQGVSLSNGALRFRRTQTGNFRIDDVRPLGVDPPPPELKDFLDKRLTCPPVVVEGRVVAYNWVTHKLPGFEDIYLDHFIVDVSCTFLLHASELAGGSSAGGRYSFHKGPGSNT